MRQALSSGSPEVILADAERPKAPGLLPEALVICAEGRAAAERCLRAVVAPRQEGAPAVLFLGPLTVSESSRLVDVCRQLLGSPVLFGAAFGPYERIGTQEAVLRFSGDMDAYERMLPVLGSLGGATYAGEEPVMVPLLSSVVSGVHHASVLALLDGVGMCAKYGLDPTVYARMVAESTPALSQGAYRNIWSGLADERSFDDVDDDIHAMEMLVHRLKSSGAAGLIEGNQERQHALNRMLRDYWAAVEKRALGRCEEDV